MTTDLPTSRSRTNWAVTATPSVSGVSASPPLAWPDFKTPRAPDGPGPFPPDERLHVLTLACSAPDQQNRPVTRWSLDELAATIVNDAHRRAISRATLWRILEAADLKPHKSIYWLNSHDPAFEAIAQEVCRLYVQAPALKEQGHLLVCTDEKSGMQVLQRCQPTRRAIPGHPERRERDYIRHGTRALIASFVVPTGEVVWDLGPTRTNDDFAAHLLHTLNHFAGWPRITWVVDNLNIHWSLQVCEILAAVNGRPFDLAALRSGGQRRSFVSDPAYPYRFVFLPKHGSWLNQVELFFSVLVRRFLHRGDFAGLAEFAERLRAFLEDYNGRQAHPYRWTYTGEPLARGTPWSQTRRQQRQGRAWCGPRPPGWLRVLYPPRPYKRLAA
jgi:transposase